MVSNRAARRLGRHHRRRAAPEALRRATAPLRLRDLNDF